MDLTQDMGGAPPPRRAQTPRFLPGTILDRRFRIVSPLGRGGMGEVYRADDMKLGVPVALKFVTRAMEQDATRLEMLLEEVKLARQVSHPNVCRVWDAGETDGVHFVAMEYVDGEDLRSLLRRIGRLPEDRGVQMAREICAGLAAIHDQGLLHRDLKPANVLIDGRGRVRIADFGLATLAGDVDSDTARGGTPAYMAPEQRAGREVTAQSDIYALGLVLYEVFTGHAAVESGAVATESRVTTPSSHVRTLDPVVESAIMRCLEPDPAMRPKGALAVAAALPGGDPVMAALAAGETPSPEMVAASGGAGGLRSIVAFGLAGAVVAGVIACMVLSETRGLPFEPDDKPYVALRENAKEFLRSIDMAQAGDDVDEGFTRNRAEKIPRGAPARNVFYWYRRSALPVPAVYDERLEVSGGFAIPAMDKQGERALRFDLRGRLLEFRRLPLATDTLAAVAPSWSAFFTAAGMDSTHLTPTTPRLVPVVPTDIRTAWIATTERGETRVEAGAFGGRPTSFVVGEPFTVRHSTHRLVVSRTIAEIVPIFLLILLAYFARRNMRAGRADTRGALRLLVISFVLLLFGFGLFANPHIKPPGGTLLFGVGITLYYALLQAIAYLALEPIVRRHHPQWLASWSRIVDGRWADRLVGRDLLVGTLVGVVLVVGTETLGLLRHTVPSGDYQAAAVGGHVALAVILRGIALGILRPMLYVLFLTIFQVDTRRRPLAWILWLVAMMALEFQGPSLVILLLRLVITLVFGVLLMRVGLLATMAAYTVFAWINEEYITTHLDAWYAGGTVTYLIAIGLLVAWAVYAATRPARGVARA